MDQQTASEAAKGAESGFSVMTVLWAVIPSVAVAWITSLNTTSKKVASIEATLDQHSKQLDTILTHLLDKGR